MWTAALARGRGGRKYHPDAPHHENVTEAPYPRLESLDIMREFNIRAP
jgi:hypothetical protein